MENCIADVIWSLNEVQRWWTKILEVGAQPMAPWLPSDISQILEQNPWNIGAWNDVFFDTCHRDNPMHVTWAFQDPQVWASIQNILGWIPDIIFGTQVFDSTLPDWMNRVGMNVSSQLDEILVQTAYHLLRSWWKLIILNIESIPNSIDSSEWSYIDTNFYLNRRPANLDTLFHEPEAIPVYISGINKQNVYVYTKN